MAARRPSRIVSTCGNSRPRAAGSSLPHAVLACAAAVIAVVLVVTGVERFGTGTGPRATAANPPVAPRSPFASDRDAKQEQETVLSVASGSAPRHDAQRLALGNHARKEALEAVTALADMPGEQADSSLSSVALSHGDPAVREEAVYALSERRGTIALRTLQEALHDSSPRVRDAAIRALVDANADDAATLLSMALRAEDVATRLSAIDALGEVGGPEATRYIEQMLRDDNDVVREAAAEWMSELSVEH